MSEPAALETDNDRPVSRRTSSLSRSSTVADNAPSTVKANPPKVPEAKAPLNTIPPEIERVRKGKRRWVLLVIFSVAMYLDVAGRSGVLVFTEPILEDLSIRYESSSWILNAYNVTFAAGLPFWGRVSDLFSAKPVFYVGFLGYGITSLIVSFMPEQYSFFVFRAISGIFASATIPSAFRLIMAVFEPHEVHTAITLFSLTGAIANATGLIIGGIFGLITADGQMDGWRWFFRFVCLVSVPFSLLAAMMVPKVKGARAGAESKWKQFDLLGCFILLSSTLLLILGLTLGASFGWKTAKFLVPFLLSWPLFVAFFIWEYRLPQGYAIVPPSFWKIPNMSLLMFVGLEVLSYWSVVQLPLLERWQQIEGESIIIAAVRALPNGLAAMVPALILPRYLPRFNIRWLMTFSLLVSGAAFLLFIFSDGNIVHNSYWRWIFPGLIIGSAFNAISFASTNVAVMKSVPPNMTGMAGALIQIAYQVGAVIGLSVQAGLLTIKPGGISNYGNIQASFWFQFGWIVLNVILVATFLRPPKAPVPPAAAAQAPPKVEKERTGTDTV